MTLINEIYHHLTGKAICTPETLAVGTTLAALLPDDQIIMKSVRTKPSGKIKVGKGFKAHLVYPKKPRKEAKG
jgi:hypothetical protein